MSYLRLVGLCVTLIEGLLNNRFQKLKNKKRWSAFIAPARSDLTSGFLVRPLTKSWGLKSHFKVVFPFSVHSSTCRWGCGAEKERDKSSKLNKRTTFKVRVNMFPCSFSQFVCECKHAQENTWAIQVCGGYNRLQGRLPYLSFNSAKSKNVLLCTKLQSQNNLNKAQNWDSEVHVNTVGKYNDKDCVSSAAQAILQKEVSCCILSKL